MIVEMKKIVVLCTQSNQDEMLESLRSLKVLHLDKIKETNNEKLELVSKKIDDIEKTKVILSSFKNNEFKNDKIDNLIEETLIKEYNWELAADTKTTWRIGDGTAGFYNYIYYTIAGFTEHDTFRSNQVREGVITRKKALELVNEENRPRYENISQ